MHCSLNICFWGCADVAANVHRFTDNEMLAFNPGITVPGELLLRFMTWFNRSAGCSKVCPG